MTRSRYRFLGNDAPYFLTMTINNWLPIFTRPETAEVVLAGWRHLREHRDFRLHGYVILENHVHLVVRSPELSKGFQQLKSYSAKRILEVLVEHLEYIHANPVKRGYVDLPEHWRWSSARNYSGQTGLIEVDIGWL